MEGGFSSSLPKFCHLNHWVGLAHCTAAVQENLYPLCHLIAYHNLVMSITHLSLLLILCASTLQGPMISDDENDIESERQISFTTGGALMLSVQDVHFR